MIGCKKYRSSHYVERNNMEKDWWGPVVQFGMNDEREKSKQINDHQYTRRLRVISGKGGSRGFKSRPVH